MNFKAHFYGIIFAISAILLSSNCFAQNLDSPSNPNVAQNQASSNTQTNDAISIRNWQWFSRCSANDAEACFHVGQVFHNGEGLPKDDQMAIDFYKKACLGRNADGCFHAGKTIELNGSNNLEEYSPPRYYKFACNLGKADACAEAGLFYLNGNERGLEIAKSVLIDGCELQSSESCRLLGTMYLNGRGVIYSKTYAARLFRRSCAQNNHEACLNYEEVKNYDDNSSCTLPFKNVRPIRGFDVENAYPKSALEHDIEGIVSAIIYVDKDGEIDGIVIKSANPIGVFEEAVIEEAKLMTFSPAKRCSQNTSSHYTLSVTFKLFD